MDSLGGEEAPGEESGEGEALVAPEWPAQWRRLRFPEMGKKTSPGRLAATGELGEHFEAACGNGTCSGPLLIVQRGRFAAAVDKFTGEPPLYSSRASWRRRELEDTREDEAELFQVQVASGRGLGGTDLA